MTATLTSFKRATKVGDRFEVTRQDYRPELVGTVLVVTANTARHLHYDLGWERPASGLMAWPTAGDVVSVSDTEFTYRVGGHATRRPDLLVTWKRVPT